MSPVIPGRYSSPRGSYCANPRCGRRPDGDADTRPVYGADVICERCADRLERQLDELARVYDELEGVLAAASGSARFDTGSVSGSRTPPAPVRLDVADHRDWIRGLLVSWTGLVVDERDLTDWPKGGLNQVARFLCGHVGWLAQHDAAGDLCNETAAALGRARGLLRGGGPVVYLPCPDVDENDCVGRIRVTPETTVARCEVCGWETNDLPWLGTILRNGEPALVTAVDACHRLLVEGYRITPSTIRSWVQRGQVTVRGREQSQRGRSLYDLDELRDRLTATHVKATARTKLAS